MSREVFMPEAGVLGGPPVFQGGRRFEETVSSGVIIREADLTRDAQSVRDLYIQPSVIEHLADVRPDYPTSDLRRYYRTHPNARLLVAELPGEGVVGSITIAPEEGLRSVKLNRLVVREDRRRHGIARRLVREALSRSFSSVEAGGYGAQQVFVAVILGIEGSEKPIRTFEGWNFDFHGGRLMKRCDSWSVQGRQMVSRDTRQMVLQREQYVMRHGKDLKKPPLS